MSDSLAQSSAHKALQSEFAAIRMIADLVADLSHEQVLRVFGYVADLKAKEQARSGLGALGAAIGEAIRDKIARGEFEVSDCDCPNCRAARAAANPPKH